MLRYESYESLMEKMGHLIVDQTLVRIDYERISTAYYGVHCNPFIFSEKMLIIGVRSGLEILISKSVNKDINIHIIEPIKTVKEKIEKIGLNNLYVYSSFEDYFESVDSCVYDYVRIDSTHFSFENLKKLYAKHNVISIFGDFEEVHCKPISLYRLSRQSCNLFYFNVKGKEYNISGTRKINDCPEVSVVVAAYGVESYLDECISSLVHQTLKNIEILIVDDGSVDLTGTKADEWHNRFPDIVRVIHKDNGGCASARVSGMMEAKGEYVAFVDGDDWVEQPMYEELFESAAIHNSEISQCGFYEFFADQTKNFHSNSWGSNGQNGTRGLVGNSKEYLTLMPSIWRRIYKKSFLEKYDISFPIHIRRHDDLPFAFISLARVRRMSVIPDCYYAYRLNRPGQDVGATDERLFIHFEIFEWLYEKVRPWASNEIMEKMRDLEIGTHNWVISRLDTPLKQDYLNKSIKGIINRYENDTNNDNWIDRLRKTSML